MEIYLYDHVGSLSLHHSSGNPIHLLTTAVDIEKSAGSLETRGGVRPVQVREFILDSSSEQLRPARLIRRSKLIPGNKRIKILLLRSSRGVRPVQVMGFIQSWKVPGGFVSSQRGTCVVPRGIRTTTALGQLHLPEEACTFANGQRHGMDLGEESEESLEITRGSSSKQVLEFVQFQP